MDQTTVFHLTALCITIANVCIFSERKNAMQISGLAFCAVAFSLQFSSRDVPPAGIIIWAVYFGFGALLAWVLWKIKTFVLSKTQTGKIVKRFGIAVLFIIAISLLAGFLFPIVGFPTEKHKGNIFGILLIALCLIIGAIEEFRFHKRKSKFHNGNLL